MNNLKTISKWVALSLMTVATSGFAITEDDDSVRSWGPWSTLVQPAAGPQIPAPTTVAGPVVPGFGSGDTNQFTPAIENPITTPPVEAVEGRCVAGSACGYAFIFNAVLGAEDSVSSSLQTATPTLTPIPVNGQFAAPDESSNVFALAPISTSLTVSSDTSLSLSQSIANASVIFSGATSWDASSGRLIRLRGNTVDVAGTPFVYGNSRVFEVGDDIVKTETIFIYGESTGLDDLNALGGEIAAEYNGFTLTNSTPVSITLNFSENSWSGIWNGGSDSGVTASISSDNLNVLSGNVGFTASGTINGVNIISNSISAGDGAISGTVNASLYGGEAGVLAGQYDVIKTTDNYIDATDRDLFVAGKNDVQLTDQLIQPE